MANAIEALVYAQQLLRLPESQAFTLVRSEGCLARDENTLLLALINSGTRTRRVGILTSAGPSVFPGGARYASFADYIEDQYPDLAKVPTPGNDLTREMLRRATRTDWSGANFDQAALRRLDRLIHRALGAGKVARLARILGLHNPAARKTSR